MHFTPPEAVASLPRMTEFPTGACRAGAADAVRDRADARTGASADGIAVAGCAAPGRSGAARLAEGAGPAAPVLDCGCGTGLSGATPGAAGSAVIDGIGLSPGRLARAGARGLRRRRIATAPDQASAAGGCGANAACGVLAPGCASFPAREALVAGMDRGAILARTLNDPARADPAFAGSIPALAGSGRVRLRRPERSAHRTRGGIGAVVSVLDRL